MNLDNRVAIENDKARVDARAKVTGAAKYTFDIALPNMLWATFVRFPYGTGRLVSSDIEAAKKVRGVLEVELYQEAGAQYVGARLGHIVAESKLALEDALAALACKFEIGNPVANAELAYKGPEEPNREDAEALKAMYESAATVVEATYRTQVQTHSALEPHCGVIDVRDGKVNAWASTQGVHAYADSLTGPTGARGSDILVNAEYVGGGFGAKFDAGAEGSLAARISKKYNRPCKIALSRRDEHLDTGNRPGSFQYMKIAASQDGTIIGGRIHVTGVSGYRGGGAEATNPALYNFGTIVKSDGDLRLCSGQPRAFRAPGWPQGVFAVESMMDELAERLKMDPLEFRLKNETSDRRRAQYAVGAQHIGWSTRPKTGSQTGRFRRGLGMGSTMWPVWPTQCGAEVDIHRDGTVEVRSGVQDIGTGTFTIVADIAARELKIPRERIVPKVGLSSYPEGPGSGGSMTARSVAPAVMDACRGALVELREAVAKHWSTNVKNVLWTGEQFKGPEGKLLEWDKACATIGGAKVSARGKIKKENTGEGTSDGCQFVEVEVDTETGVVRVKKVVAIQSCGLAINRRLIENQICGGVIQGISYALFEDRILDRKTGGMVNPNLEWYKIAGSMDVPPIVPIIDCDPKIDTGVRPIGEPTTIPTAGAIANAVANAIGGRVRSLPITPERVLQALHSKGASA